MLKTRHFPERKVLSDRSDIVALHAKLLRCEYDRILLRHVSGSRASLECRHSADISTSALPYFESSSTSNAMQRSDASTIRLSMRRNSAREKNAANQIREFLRIAISGCIADFASRHASLPCSPRQRCKSNALASMQASCLMGKNCRALLLARSNWKTAAHRQCSRWMEILW